MAFPTPNMLLLIRIYSIHFLMIFKHILFMVLGTLVAVLCHAQPGTLDLSFDPWTGANGQVNSTSIQADGMVIIGGQFTSYNGTGRSRIARLNADGSLDTNFDPGTGAGAPWPSVAVFSTAVQADGKILIGGAFTSYDGTGRNCIARLNPDGSLDTSFDPGTGANNSVRSIAVQSDGKIVIVGNFSSYDGTGRNRIARLNTDGSLDTSFDPGSGVNGIVVYAATLQADGKIIISGTFSTYNGVGRNNIARLNTDGSLDTSFEPGSGANAVCHSSAVQADGKIIIAGSFTSYNGTASHKLARLNSNGSIDTGFNIGAGPDNTSYSIVVLTDGKIIIGGTFSNFNSVTRGSIARLNADGSLDTDFDPGGGANNTVYSIAVQPDGKFIIGGSFSTYGITGRNRIARIYGGCLTDTDPPVITACPSDTAVNCAADLPTPDINSVSATDDCGAVTITHEGDVSDGGTNPEIITRTYRATDSDGNFVECTHVFTVISPCPVPAGSGSALDFDGSNDFVDLGSSVINGVRTVEMWFRPSVFIDSTISSYITLIARNDNGENDEFQLYFSSEPTYRGKLFFGRTDGAFNSFGVASDNKEWLAGVWYHVAAVIHPINGMELYINGIKQADTHPDTSTPGVRPEIVALAQWGNFTARHFTGRIDEVRIWNTALNQTEIREHMCKKNLSSHPKVGDLKAYYRFDDGTGSGILQDITGNGFDGTLDNMNPMMDWITSGAPIGDESSQGYGSSSVTHTSSTSFTANNYTGSPVGVHVYKVNEAPNDTTVPDSYTALETSEYYGVHLIGGNNPTYTAILDYSTNANIDGQANESDIRIASRANNAAGAFADIATQTLDAGLNTVTVPNQSGTEYIPGFSKVRVHVKAFLEGPYDGAGLMHDSLRASGYIPLMEPFTGLGFTHVGGGGEVTTNSVLDVTGNDAIVDWVFLELRSATDSTGTLATASALIQRDGDVVDADGISPVSFPIPANNYFVAIQHRNHLGCMTAAPINLTGTPVTVNFTDPATSTWGVEARKTVGPDAVLWTGNVVIDDELKYIGSNNDRDRILIEIGGAVPTNTTTGYKSEDVNMDGTVKYIGTKNDRDPILINIGGSVPTNVRTEQLP